MLFSFRMHPLALLAGCLFITSQVWAGADRADWPQFRGLHRDGVSQETDLRETWADGPPRMVWVTPIGQGFSAVSIVGDRCFSMYGLEDEASEGGEFAASFDAATGRELWRTRMGNYFTEEFGNGPRATPTVVDGVAYCVGSFGDFLALNADTGDIIWQLNLKDDLGMIQPRFGYSVSPLVHQGHVIIDLGGGPGKAFAALDAKTGSQVWTSQDGGPHGPGYSSPILISNPDHPQYVFTTGSGLVGLTPDGIALWTFTGGPQGPMSMPVFVPPHGVFASNADDVGAVMVSLEEKQDQFNANEAWQLKTMRNNWSSSVTIDGHIYGFDHAALKCLDAATGDVKWVQRGYGKGSLIAVGEHLLVLTDRGQLVLAKIDPQGFSPLGRFAALDGKSWTAPSFSGGRVYLRNLTEMACYDLRLTQ